MRVVVCGAGVIGAAVAYYLSLRGVAATVVERAGVACAASGKSGGFLARDWCDGSPLGPLARASFDLHRELGEALPGTGYRRVETLLVRDDPSTQRPRGRGWLDRGARIRAHLGTVENTAQVHPERFTRALLDAACARGARLRRGVVNGLALAPAGDAARVTGVRLDDETLPADVAVLALGPWTASLSPALPVPPVFGLRGNSVVLRPRVPVPAECLFVETDDPSAGAITPEIYPRPDGEVYVCGMADDLPFPADPLRIERNDAACRLLLDVASRLSSALAEAEIVRAGACFRPVTGDGLPLLGPLPGVSGAIVATGHSCWGILNAPASGRALAELITEGASSRLDIAPFDPGRFPGGRPGARAGLAHRARSG